MTAIVVLVRPASRPLAAVPRRGRPVHRTQEPPAGRGPTTPDARPADVRPADVRPADVRPADVRPAGQRPGG